MTDRQLLEDAAKAAGFRAVKSSEFSGFGDWLAQDDAGDWTAWNPLTDDGDALRMAVKLNLDLALTSDFHVAAWCPAARDFMEEPREPDPYAATRRAVVRAAAAIGEGMTQTPTPAAPEGVPPKPLDDPKLQQVFGDAIEGALAFGYQGTNKPPEGHWLWRFWNLGRNQALSERAAPPAESALRDTARLDWLESEFAREGEWLASDRSAPMPPSLFRGNLPITRATIDAAMGASPRQPQRARKVGGSYQASGHVIAEFKTIAGLTRYVFEFDAPTGMLHIFGPEQVEFALAPKAPEPGTVAEPVAEAQQGVTPSMVSAYLTAHDTYWREVDALPGTPGVWRNGTPREATRVGLIAALAAAPAAPAPAWCQCEPKRCEGVGRCRWHAGGEVNPKHVVEARALEFAEYMAKAAEQFIDATDDAAMKRAIADGAPHNDHRPLLCDRAEQADSDAIDALRSLKSRICEFRKRRDAALASSSAPAAVVPRGQHLTDEQCDEFRRLNCGFNDMVRAIYEAGRQLGMDQERALWQLAADAQAMGEYAAAPSVEPARAADSQPVSPATEFSQSTQSAPPAAPPAALVEQARIYAWLGFWRDKIPPKAVAGLQSILGPLVPREGS